MHDPGQTSDPSDAADKGRRLDSWKAIAAYLKRTVRTVHRWEKHEELPVHRHLHRKQGRVYAYTAELDAWLQTRDPQGQSPAQEKTRWRLLASLAGAVLVLGIAGYLWTTAMRSAQAPLETMPHSIAVLPFHSVDPSGTQAMLAQGIAAAVLDRLNDVRSLTVIARASAFAFDSQPLDPVTVADRLRVHYLLTGDLQALDDRLRIHARLVDASGRQLWSESFDRTSSDAFEMQNEIAAAVVNQLALTLDPEYRAEARPHPDAYQNYLLGREHLSLRSWPALDAAASAFERAIAIDPEYANAYGGLAMVRALQIGSVHNPVSASKARVAAELAFEKNDQLVDAKVALGRILHLEGNLKAAEREFAQALALDPGFIDARLWLSSTLSELGRYDEARAQLERGLETDPLHPVLNATLANLHWSSGNFSAAKDRYKRLLDLPKTPPWVHARLVLLHRDYGLLQQAMEWAKRGAVAHAADVNWALDGLILTYARLGMEQDAERWLSQLDAARGGAWIGLQSEYWYLHGRFEDVHQLNMAYLANARRPVESMPLVVRQAVGAFQVLTMRYDDGIATLRTLYGEPFRIPEGTAEPLHGPDFSLMIAQLLAHAYQQVGNESLATRTLDRIDAYVARLQRAGLGDWPNLHIARARNLALLGDHPGALGALREAVNKGWRDIAFERHNPCWTPLQTNPEYVTLMDLVQADIAAQRALVEAAGPDEEFEARLLGLLR